MHEEFEFRNKARIAIFGSFLVFAVSAIIEFCRSYDNAKIVALCPKEFLECRTSIRGTTLALGLSAILLMLSAAKFRQLDESADTSAWRRLTRRISARVLRSLHPRFVEFSLAASIPVMAIVLAESIASHAAGPQSLNSVGRVLVACFAAASFFLVGFDVGTYDSELVHISRDLFAVVTAIIFFRIRTWAGWTWAEVGQAAVIMASALALWNGLPKVMLAKAGPPGLESPDVRDDSQD
jgi:hypothetical protein